MDLFKSQFDRVSQQLAGLTPSQKMLSASLVVIMVMTLWWWGRYAGAPEMQPLLDQPLAQEDIAKIDLQLSSMGIDHTVGPDSRIMVPADMRVRALAALGYANMLPKSTGNGWDEMIKQLTPWDGQSRESAVFNHGKEVALQQVISHFPGVASAHVIIDPTFNRRIGHGNIEPTATVTVATRDGAGSLKQLAAACAHVVSGAQAGLSPSRVKVIINGKPYPVLDPQGPAQGLQAETVLEMQQAAETLLTQKLEQQLNWIDGVRVSVTVKVNNATSSSDRTIVDKEKSFTAESRTTSKSREDVTSQPASGEGGVVPNTGLSIEAPVAAGPQQTSSETLETVENFVLPAVERIQTHTPAGGHTAIAASVRIPRRYFVGVAKNGDPAAKDPDPAALEKAIQDELPKIKKDAAACTGIDDLDAITVEPYFDLLPADPAGAEVASASAFSLMVGGHMKEIILGGLALASLFMMSMIVRRGAPAAAAAAPAAVTASELPAVIGSFEALAGEVTEQNPTLDGMELDEDSIKTQQMLSQVTSMVSESPDAAAQLIKRWMNQR